MTGLTRWREAAAVLSLALALGSGGCGDTSAGSADKATDLYEAGVLRLYMALSGVSMEAPPWEWEADVSEPLEFFEAALDEDPDHCGALLGSSVARIIEVVTDPELRVFLRYLSGDREGEPAEALFWYLRMPVPGGAFPRRESPAAELVLSQLQEHLENESIPSLEVADERLRLFEELGCEVDFAVVVPSVTPGDFEVYRFDIDVTDALFVHCALDALEASLHTVCAYNIDRDEGQSLEELVEDDPDFLVLRDGGHLPSTYSELRALADRLSEAAASLGGETDPQDDDVITESEGLISLEDILGQDPLGEIERLSAILEGAVTEGLSVNPSSLAPGDPAAPDIEVMVDVEELLTDPLHDIRLYFPPHTWPTPDSMAITLPIAMPDPTLDGITPTMTDGDWEVVIPWLLSRALR